MFWKVSCWLFRKKWPVRDIYHLALLISKLDETNENKYFKNRIESVYYLSRFMNKKTEKIWKNVLNKFEFINSSIRQCVLIQKIKMFFQKISVLGTLSRPSQRTCLWMKFFELLKLQVYLSIWHFMIRSSVNRYSWEKKRLLFQNLVQTTTV